MADQDVSTTREDIPRFVKRNGVAVCEACGAELGSGIEPGPAGRGQKYAGHRDDCAFMVELWGDNPPDPDGRP